MAYLVTGGMGYIGSRSVRDLLSAGKEVVCLDPAGITPLAREVIGEENLEKLKLIRGDVSDATQLFRVVREHRVDKIIHYAFVMGHEELRSRLGAELRPAYSVQVNCQGFINVLEAAHLFGVTKVVWTSAVLAFGRRIGEFHKEPLGDDDAVFMPDTIYGSTKLLKEVLAKVYFERFGVDSIGFRVANVFGHDNSGMPFTRFNRQVALNLPVTLTDPDYVNSYIYVEDCADAHVKACEVPITKTRVFNLREGEYTNRQLFEIISKVNPEAQVSLVEGKSESGPVPRFDASGVRRELGWQARHSMAEALRETYNHWRRKEGMPPL